jgi:hypothetical protein
VEAGLPQENAPAKIARIPIAKPALKPIFSVLNFRAGP